MPSAVYGFDAMNIVLPIPMKEIKININIY